MTKRAEEMQNRIRHPKMYMTDEARQSAINDINKHIDKISSIPCDVVGGYTEATRITRYLSMLIDQIAEEADAPELIDRYARGPQKR